MGKSAFILQVVLWLILFQSCEQKRDGYPYNMGQKDTLLPEIKETSPDDIFVFRSVIDSIYSVIKDQKFDTLAENGIQKVGSLEDHRMIQILLAKKQIKKEDLERISGLYRCVCKHQSVKKKNSEDLVIEEYVCKSADDAAFLFNQVYNVYMEGKNPLGEPLKEPYKLWQSSNRLVHIYTRALMWQTEMNLINKAMMKNYTFTGKENE